MKKKGEFPVYKSSSKIRKILYYNIPLSFAKRGLLTKDYTHRMKGKIHVVRELDLIRIYDLFLQR